MDKKALEAVLMQLSQLNANIEKLIERVDKNTTDLADFSERFEEVMTTVEDERRMDLLRDYE